MSVLRTIESKIEALFEGVFGRAFRSHVQPVELARKLVKEMDDHRTVSVSRVYVPNEYSVYLSPDDRSNFSDYERSLIGELQDYLAEHARRERFALLSSPVVVFHTDEDIQIGEFGIATRMVPKGPQEPGAPAAEAAPGATMIYRQAQQQTEAADAVETEAPQEVAALEFAGRRYELSKPRTVLGRSRECDIQVPDPNISRRHAEIRREGEAWWVVDLGSTNGVMVDGRREQRLRLEPGTRFTIGSTDVVFSRETA
jgi:FHA domain-containing protein